MVDEGFKSFDLSPLVTGGTVLSSILGGAVLGVATVFKTGMTGEVLGISGSTRGLMMKPGLDKVLFLFGLSLAGIIMVRSYDGAFEPTPPVGIRDTDDHTKYLLRIFFGGMMVGLGTSCANGCTSGHGLTGLARITLRSWVGVPVFMFFGALSATLSGSVRYMRPDALTEELAQRWEYPLFWSMGAIFVCIATGMLFVFARKKLSPEGNAKLKLLGEFVSGFCFGCGMGISGMSRASKVCGFLDLGSGAWDPSLGFVMCGALAFTFPFFTYIERLNKESKPVLGGRFMLFPRSAPLDFSLIFGTAVFGTGWGLCGMCPGPIWVNVGAGKAWEVCIVLLGLMIGMAFWVVWFRVKQAKARNKGVQEPEPMPMDGAAPEGPVAEKTVIVEDFGVVDEKAVVRSERV